MAQKFDVSRQVFILNRFKEDFPQYNTMDFEEIMKFIQTSKQLKIWFSSLKEELAFLRKAPSWFTAAGLKADVWSTDYLPTFEKVSEVRAKYSVTVKKLSEDYNKAILAAASERDRSLSAIVVNPVISISVLEYDDLPLEILFQAKSKSLEAEPGQRSEKAIFLDNALEALKLKLMEIYLSDKVNFRLTDHIKDWSKF